MATVEVGAPTGTASSATVEVGAPTGGFATSVAANGLWIVSPDTGTLRPADLWINVP